MSHSEIKTVGIAGMGAIGSTVAQYMMETGIEGLDLIGMCDRAPPNFEFALPNLSFEQLTERCDIIVEALPASAAFELAKHVLEKQKTLVLISSCTLLLYPELLDIHKLTNSRIYVPSGALLGVKDLKSWSKAGITEATISSSKHPRSFEGTPYVDEMGINLDQITVLTKIFEGTAQEAAKGFPANVNVAATLSFAGVGPHKTLVEIWADPNASGNAHTVTVTAGGKEYTATASSKPDPRNPKSSSSTPRSIIETLQNFDEALVTL